MTDPVQIKKKNADYFEESFGVGKSMDCPGQTIDLSIVFIWYNYNEWYWLCKVLKNWYQSIMSSDISVIFVFEVVDFIFLSYFQWELIPFVHNTISERRKTFIMSNLDIHWILVPLLRCTSSNQPSAFISSNSRQKNGKGRAHNWWSCNYLARRLIQLVA